MPVGGKSREEEHGKDKQVWWELQMRYPGYCMYQTIQHRHRRPGWVL